MNIINIFCFVNWINIASNWFRSIRHSFILTVIYKICISFTTISPDLRLLTLKEGHFSQTIILGGFNRKRPQL